VLGPLLLALVLAGCSAEPDDAAEAASEPEMPEPEMLEPPAASPEPKMLEPAPVAPPAMSARCRALIDRMTVTNGLLGDAYSRASETVALTGRVNPAEYNAATELYADVERLADPVGECVATYTPGDLRDYWIAYLDVEAARQAVIAACESLKRVSQPRMEC